MAYQSWSVVFEEQPSVAKWNILGTNDASFNDGTGIGASAITPEKLLSGTGTSWAWTTWSPSYTGLTVGSGTVSAYYKQHGKTVFFRFKFTYGSGSSIGSVGVTPPVTPASYYNSADNVFVGPCYAKDAGTASYAGFTVLDNVVSSTMYLRPHIYVANATYATITGLSSSIPMTWTTSDVLEMTGVYEAA